MTAIAVLTAAGVDRPAALRALEGRVEMRWADAAGLPEALDGAEALLRWDFETSSLPALGGAADRLRWVHTPTAGADAVLTEEVRGSAVVVTNARGVFDRPIAEWILGTALMFAKRSAESLELQRERVWRHRETETLAGTRALIVGLGGIGRETGRLLRAFDVDVIGAASRARIGDDVFSEIIDSSDLVGALGEIDWLINAAPLTERTRGLFDAAVFAALPPHARFISVGRGASTVTDDLLTALRTGEIAGAGLDVVDPEPLPADHPLWAEENVIITAHLSGDTVGWRDRLAEQYARLVEDFLARRELNPQVDPDRGYVPSS